ncbi:MAG TPA: hypothetical protein DDZ80_13465 [Cyanobacteria bacterium UBA8803]|nr:hypothetical protein [Cyanobacteria bacterium UBA9273]HBL59479.1 hypothetical protein [Cyanobacteria bacterium UBA8803]
MLIPILKSLKYTFSNAQIRVGSVIAIISLIGFSTVGNYGLSIDEAIEISMVKWNYELIAKGTPIPKDLRYYGTVFNVSAEVLFQVSELLEKGSLNMADTKDSSQLIRDRIKIKHPFTFLISLLAYISVAAIVGIFCGFDYAWCGPIVLALFPMFWGHSFFNPKDVPFAALFILCSCVGAYVVERYVQKGSKTNIGFNNTTIISILYGILVGLNTSIRVGGLVLIPFTLIAYGVITLGSIKHHYKNWLNIAGFYGVMVIAWATTTIICFPSSWANPIQWLFETVGYLSDHSWKGIVLFEGKLFFDSTLPWYYIPKWVAMTLPLIFQVAFVFGIIFIISKYSKFSDLQRACAILILLQIFFLPSVAIIKGSIIYNSIRQFLFILPAIAAIASTALVFLYQNITKTIIQRFTVASLAVVFTHICFDMVALHPYEYIYFNRIFGGLTNAHTRYETDYWGLSMREAMEWVNRHSKPGTKVLVGGPFYAAKIFADPSLVFPNEGDFIKDGTTRINKLEKLVIDQPYYYIAAPMFDKHNSRRAYQQVFPECDVVYQVLRQKVPLAIVKHCR